MSQLFGDAVATASAGIPGFSGQAMDPAMEAELPVRDGRASAHRSRVLTRQILEASPLVLTMEFAHQIRILDEWPAALGYVFGLRQFVDTLDRWSADQEPVRIDEMRKLVAPNSAKWDVRDPYRRGQEAARRCADELDDLLLRLGAGLGLEPKAQD